MKIEGLTLGYLETNTYFISKNDQLIIIDPCLDPNNNPERIFEKINDKNVLAILLTHGHFDHISAVDMIVNKYGCDVYMHEKEHHYLTDPQYNLSMQSPELVNINAKPKKLNLGLNKIGIFEFDVFMTPGHTSYSVSIDFNNHVFDGDFIFKNSIGRTDFITGSMEDMKNSIINFDKKYHNLNPKLYPGHGPITQYQKEKENNPYLLKFL